MTDSNRLLLCLINSLGEFSHLKSTTEYKHLASSIAGDPCHRALSDSEALEKFLMSLMQRVTGSCTSGDNTVTVTGRPEVTLTSTGNHKKCPHGLKIGPKFIEMILVEVFKKLPEVKGLNSRCRPGPELVHQSLQDTLLDIRESQLLPLLKECFTTLDSLHKSLQFLHGDLACGMVSVANGHALLNEFDKSSYTVRLNGKLLRLRVVKRGAFGKLQGFLKTVGFNPSIRLRNVVDLSMKVRSMRCPLKDATFDKCCLLASVLLQVNTDDMCRSFHKQFPESKHIDLETILKARLQTGIDRTTSATAAAFVSEGTIQRDEILKSKVNLMPSGEIVID